MFGKHNTKTNDRVLSVETAHSAAKQAKWAIWNATMKPDLPGKTYHVRVNGWDDLTWDEQQELLALSRNNGVEIDEF